MEGLAIEEDQLVGGIAADFAAGDSAAAAVLAIAEHRAADVVQMDADLVRPPGLGQHFHRGKALESLERFVERLGGPALGVVVADRHLFADVRVEPDRAVDDVAVAGGLPDTSAKYSFSIDRAANCFESLAWATSFRATRIAPLVSRSSRWTMPGRLSPPGAEARSEAELQGAGQRARPMAAGRMHDHARRLVDDHHVVVLVEDIQRNVFRPRRLAWDVGQSDRNTLVGLEPIRWFAAAAIDLDAAGHDDAGIARGCNRESGLPRHRAGSPTRRHRRSVQPARRKAASDAPRGGGQIEKGEL